MPRSFERLYPRIELPFQVVDRISTGAEHRGAASELFPLGGNRLFFGDNLHVMRKLPSESIDLIFVDPSFFTLVAVSDGKREGGFPSRRVWDGGLQDYFKWLNARFREIRRLLKPTGNLFALFEQQVLPRARAELDSIFGPSCFRGAPRLSGPGSDKILWYGKGSRSRFDEWAESAALPSDLWRTDEALHRGLRDLGYRVDPNLAGFLSRIIAGGTGDDGIFADLFCGSGTTLAVAEMMGRRWIGCDLSRTAVAVTADRIARILAPELQKSSGGRRRRGPLKTILDAPALTSLSDEVKSAVISSSRRARSFTVEHLGVYRSPAFMGLPLDEFRRGLLACYGAEECIRPGSDLHGVNEDELIWVGRPDPEDWVTAQDVKTFALSAMKSPLAKRRHPVMIGWRLDAQARALADKLSTLEELKPIQFVGMRSWPWPDDTAQARQAPMMEGKGLFAFMRYPALSRITAIRVSRLRYLFNIAKACSRNSFLKSEGRISDVKWQASFQGEPGAVPLVKHHPLPSISLEHLFEESRAGQNVSISCRVVDNFGAEASAAIKLKIR